MSDILISGYYGFKNAGDELALKSMLADLRSYKPDISITVLSLTPKETAWQHRVSSAYRWNLFSIIREVSKCKMLVSGSGGLFQDRTSMLSLWYYLVIILIAKFYKKIIFIYAAGIGEVTHNLDRFLIKTIFSRVDFIAVRTEQDKKLLESYAVQKEIVVTADPVFGLKLPVSQKAPEKENRKIGIIVRRTKEWQEDVKLFSKLSDALVKNLTAEVVFIPFQTSEDIELLKAIRDKSALPPDIFYWQNTDELLDVLAQLDLVISMRLHGLILAVKLGVPFIAISRYSKIKYFLQMIGESEFNDEITSEALYLQILRKFKSNNSNENHSLVDLENKSKETAEKCISLLTWL